MKITICLVFGLPAVGKTTLSRTLIEYMHRHTSYHCCLFTYDELMPEKIVFEEKKGNNSGIWKMHRSRVFQHIENSLITLRGTNYKDALKDTPNEKLCQCFRYDTPTAGVQHIVLIDDNLFYKSMRHIFYQLARKYECSFCQIYLEDNLDTLFKRNSSREDMVTMETILKMNLLFAVPDPQQNLWEKNTLMLSKVFSGERETVQKVLLYIEKCFNDVVKPLLTEEEIKERTLNRQKNLESYCHQCDQLLRKHISKQMMEAKSKGLQKVELQNMAEKLNTHRKKYLDQLRMNDYEEFLVFEFDKQWNINEIEKFERFSITDT